MDDIPKPVGFEFVKVHHFARYTDCEKLLVDYPRECFRSSYIRNAFSLHMKYVPD